ncbi:acetylxylan esterase [Streptomyces sp. NPDC002564]|uniref:acetylxylan esterase n=1 Tax=Streptomyces sp. NPDC002564 TaxID=3364649 RepID=UPI0036AA3C1D
MPAFAHPFPFDPTHGHALDDLLTTPAPPPPPDFATFWQKRYTAARAVATAPVVGPLEDERDGQRVYGVTYTSVGGLRLGGWLGVPAEEEPPAHGFVIGHGYGGRDAPGPDLPPPLPHSATLLPCVRGMATRSRHPRIPARSDAHVLHGISSRDTYVIADCVADLWCAASALLELFPGLAATPGPGPRLGYLGESFGGGLGALALPWDDRFAAAHLTVPTFGNHPLRLTLPCTGSGEAVRTYHREHPEVADVLRYFDAATAAAHLRVPTLTAPALFDPAVPPPGQFAVHNALAGPRDLHVLEAGHFAYEGMREQTQALSKASRAFFERTLT